MPNQIPDPPRATAHNAWAFTVERGCYDQWAHQVDGRHYLGVGGVTLDSVMRDSYRREIDAITADVLTLAGLMYELDRRVGSRDALALRERLTETAALIDELLDSDRAFTFDGPNGGRPIPPGQADTTEVEPVDDTLPEPGSPKVDLLSD